MGSRRYSDQFKAEAVQLVLEMKRPIAQVARELGVNEGTLGNWVTQWRRSTDRVPGTRPPATCGPNHRWEPVSGHLL